MKNQYKQYFILILLALIWGSSFILMEKGMCPFEGEDTYSDMQVAALRLFIAFLSLLPFVYKAFKQVKKKEIIPLLVTGLLGNGIPAFLFTIAITTPLKSSFVGILSSLTPIFTLILGIYFFRSRPTSANIFGIIIGFCGALLLYFSEIKDLTTLNIGVFLIVLATICYGTSVNVIRKYLRRLDSISISALSFLFIGPFAGYYIFTTDFLAIASTNNGMISLGYVSILAIIGTSFSVVIFNKLIKETSAIFAASVTYIIPIVAILWDAFDGKIIEAEHYLGLIIILFGVYLVNKKKIIQK